MNYFSPAAPFIHTSHKPEVQTRAPGMYVLSLCTVVEVSGFVRARVSMYVLACMYYHIRAPDHPGRF